jgi:hypothetical protein
MRTGGFAKRQFSGHDWQEVIYVKGKTGHHARVDRWRGDSMSMWRYGKVDRRTG